MAEPADSSSHGTALTEEQKVAVVSWLGQKWGNGNAAALPVCSMCKSPQMTWKLIGYVMTPVVFAKGTVNLGSTVVPVVPIMCSNCGNMHFVNAVVMGILNQVGKE
jgi:hypothetical protein